MSATSSSTELVRAVDAWLDACQRASPGSESYQKAVLDQKTVLVDRFKSMPITVTQATQTMKLLGESVHFRGSFLAELCCVLSTVMVQEGQVAKERRRLQDFSEFLPFVTPGVWRKLTNPGLGVSVKLSSICDFLSDIGLMNPTEGTIRSVAALLVALHSGEFDTAVKRHELFQCSKDFLRRSILQHSKMAQDKPYAQSLPSSWQDMPADWQQPFLNDKPSPECPVDASLHRNLQPMIPMRVTNKDLLSEQSTTQLELLRMLSQKLQLSGTKVVADNVASKSRTSQTSPASTLPALLRGTSAQTASLEAGKDGVLSSSLPSPCRATRPLPVLGGESSFSIESGEESQQGELGEDDAKVLRFDLVAAETQSCDLAKAAENAPASLLSVAQQLGQDLKLAKRLRGKQADPSASGKSGAPAKATTNGQIAKKLKVSPTQVVPAVQEGAMSVAAVPEHHVCAPEKKPKKPIANLNGKTAGGKRKLKTAKNNVGSRAYHNVRNRLLKAGVSKAKATQAARRAYKVAVKHCK